MRSMAPGAARWPELICAPSNAGPVGEEQAKTREVFPSRISAFVPTSTIKTKSSDFPGSSDNATAAASAPTWPAIQGNRYICADFAMFVRSRSNACNETDSDVAKAKGAWPNSTGSIPNRRWCITGLQTKTTSKIRLGSISASFAISSAKVLIASRTAPVISWSPPGFIME